MADGGQVGASMEQGSEVAVVLYHPIDDFEDLEEFYSGWVADQDAENVVTDSMVGPRSAGWYGETVDRTFAIAHVEAADGSGSPAVTVSLAWSAARPLAGTVRPMTGAAVDPGA